MIWAGALWMATSIWEHFYILRAPRIERAPFPR